MKINHLILTILAVATMAFIGCKKSADGAPSVDTSKFEAAFATADSATKSAADTVVAAVKGADYSGAVTQLKSLGDKFKLTDEQQAAVKDTIAKVQAALTAVATKATGAATTAATDMTKTLTK